MNTPLIIVAVYVVAFALAVFLSRRGAKSRRPVGLHPESPWPPPDAWARNEIERLLCRGGWGQQAWTDETCGDLCVVSFHPGGEAEHRHVNPACTKHRPFYLKHEDPS